MHQAYRDFLEDGAQFVPTIDLVKRADNGHFTASAYGRSVTDVSQEVAVNKLQTQLQEAMTRGELQP